MNKLIAAVGYGNDFITFRFCKELGEAGLDMNEILKHINKKYPEAMVDGGGHPVAGTIHFNKASADVVLKEVLEFMKK